MDIKQTAPEVVPYEEPLAALLRRYDRAESVIVSSFSDAAVARFFELAPEFSVGAATDEVATFWGCVQAGTTPPATPSVALQVPETFGELTVVDERFVEVAHEVGKAVHVWTINDAASMQRLLDYGVDGLISDYPTVMVAEIEARGLTWRGY
jgi:glycerophosphoryl diester phosphodiesterase